MKDKMIFAAEVLAVFGAVYLFQKKVMAIPVLGNYLPGGQ